MADTTLVALKGVTAKLLAESTLTSIVSTRVYSDIPQQTVYPYALIEISSQDWSQDDDANMQHNITVHGFSKKNSPTEAMQIAEAAYNTLNRQEDNISLDSGSVVLCIFDGVRDNFKEPDGITWHSVIEFKLIID